MGCALLLLGAQPAANATSSSKKDKQPRIRPELYAVFAPNLCQKNLPPEQAELWRQKIFDAHLEVKSVSPKPGFQVNPQKLHAAAQTLAKSRHHHGVAFGICDNGRAWAVSSAAPQRFVQRQRGELRIDLGLMQHHCKAMSLDFAEQDRATTRNIMNLDLRQLETKHLTVNLYFLGQGLASVTCLPLQAQFGPIPWAMIPTLEFGLSAPMVEQVRDPQTLGDWVNHLRSREGLPRLEVQTDINRQVAKMTADLIQDNQTVTHHRPLLQHVRQQLAQAKFELLGENRVKADTYKKMAWLLWNSPRHRRLVLNPKARIMALHATQLDQEYLLVMVMARPMQHSQLSQTKNN